MRHAHDGNSFFEIGRLSLSSAARVAIIGHFVSTPSATVLQKDSSRAAAEVAVSIGLFAIRCSDQ
jgi:hypothetical protein